MGSGWSNLISGGRTHDRPNTASRNRREPPYPYPSHWRFNTYENDDDPEPDHPPAPATPPPENPPEDKPEEPSAPPVVVVEKPLKVKAIDYNIKTNTLNHHTDEYDITKKGTNDINGKKRPQQLVIRRGHVFEFTITLDRPYNKEQDILTVIFEIGPLPRESKGTLVHLDLDGIKNSDNWESEVKEINGNDLAVKIKASHSCPIGIWDVIVQTSLKEVAAVTHDDTRRREISRYVHNQPVYILFNPWCKEDTVFLNDDILRDEYILNENGLIYTGSSYQIGSKPWNFGQFDDNILDCSMYLLNKSRLNYQSRGDPVHVSRSISAIVNEADDDGVLIGNWSGDYSAGTRPTKWVGSVAILDKYYNQKKPVKFGQCWVFSGLVTTVSRSLGLPCRSVTNFSSAHDTDGSVSIDKYFNSDGEKLNGSDSIWNFHVWNEAWMARRDLPKGYGGWQAFDATPQETSEGIYRAGPASVKAIKEGNISYQYDSPFIFAEVNADEVHWKQQSNTHDGRYTVIRVKKGNVGKNISTHRPRKDKRPDSWRNDPYRRSIDEFRDDLTLDYKYKEYTAEERAAVYRANLHSSKPGVIYGEDTGITDVNFQFKQKDGVMVGSVFNVILEMQNTSREVRTVTAKLEITPVYYTGVATAASKPIKKESFKIELPAVKTREAVMRVTVDDYIHKIVEQVTFEISAYCTVEETNQEYPMRELYRLRRPDLIITAPDVVKVAERVTVKIKLESPMPVHLTDCGWDVEGAHLIKSREIPQEDVPPFGHEEISVDITPMYAGEREIMAGFTSKELQDITASHPILVVE